MTHFNNNNFDGVKKITKQSYVKIQLEVNGLWDYRNESKEKYKAGLIIYITKIIVLK